MAFVSDYMFNGMSRIGDDVCSQDMNAIQNTKATNYSLQNYTLSDCTMRKAMDFATMQPGVNYSGSMGIDLCGTNIDENSKLTIGGIQTNPRCKLDLVQRPFATVPFLGRGTVNSLMESQIMQGESGSNRKTVTRLADKNMLKHGFTPLIPSIQGQIQNPEYLVESMAHPNWVRGGIPSRDLMRDSN